MTAVAIIEPQRLTRLGIEQVIATNLGLPVVASVGCVAELGEVEADVIVLGSRPDGQDTGTAIRELRKQAGVLMLADTPTSGELMASIQAGVGGFVTTDVDEIELLNALNAVAAGAFYLMAGLMSHLQDQPQWQERGKDRVLARREVETLQLIAAGYTHGQIARRLGLTEATVNTYVKRIRTKLNVGNKAALTRKAIDLGYVSATQQEVPGDSGRPVLTSVRMLSESA